jgi:hypothetical protein
MNRQAIIMGAAMLMLAGCHAPERQAGGNQQAKAADDAAAASFAKQIDALSEGQRNGVFMRAIADAGLDCQKATSVKPRDPVNGRPAWDVVCLNGVFVAAAAPNQTLQIVPGVVASGS